MSALSKGVHRILIACMAAGIFSSLHAQIYPPTFKVAVTYYDFHSNGTNPEFECPHYSMVRDHMVDTILDAQRKPRLGTKPYINYYIKYWFRNWNDSAKKDYTIPIYTNLTPIPPATEFTSTIRYDGNKTVAYNTAFQDSVIKDFLTFTHTGGGVYTYVNNEFFPIDNRGFGNEGRAHNYSFTMELNWEFTKVPGQKFTFEGDDDVWVFIDGKRVIDLGGIHEAARDFFELDSIALKLGLQNGKKYTIDVFYAERHTTASDIIITSNIISPPPSKLNILVQPNDTIYVGDSATAIANIFNEYGDTIKNLTNPISWTWKDAFNHDSTFKQKTNKSLVFKPTEAYTTAILYGRYQDVSQNVDLKDSVKIVVLPGPVHHLVIEPTADSLASLRNDNPKAFVRISGANTLNEDFYAILRDMYGNWIRPAYPAAWTSADITVATAQAGATPARGQGRANRIASSIDTTIITGTYTNPAQTKFSDNIDLYIDPITYDALQIVVHAGGKSIPVDSIYLRTDQDTTVYVEGQRSDTKLWVDVDATWTSSGILVSPTAPTTASNFWNFQPIQTSNGTITARTQGTGGTIQDLVYVKITHGPPEKMDLYDNEGNPALATVKPLADTIDVVAGVNQTIVAKLFDNLNEWLAEFELTDSLKNRISWACLAPTGKTATLSTNNGHKTVFNSEDARGTYLVTATYTYGSKLLNEKVAIRVLPAAPAMLVIEGDSRGLDASPNKPNPIDTVVITETETNRLTYAVLRDSFGNFVRFSQPTTWVSLDTNVVTAQSGALVHQGQGIISRVAASDTTKVTAVDVSTKLNDSTVVIILPYYYINLKIVAKNPLDSNLTQIIMNTNQDTTLYVMGQRSDNNKWEFVSAADWSKSSNLKTAQEPPRGSPLWTFSPTDTGRGYIVVSKGKAIDSLAIKFIPGPPTRLTLTVLTPDYQRIAGQPIDAEIRLYNKDGLVPGISAGTTIFNDLLNVPAMFDLTGAKVVPSVINDGITTALGLVMSNDSVSGGIDTVQLLLYYAPPSHDLHTMEVRFTDSRSIDPLIDSAGIVLLPGPVAKVTIVENVDPAITRFLNDMLTLDFQDSTMVRMVGYDRFHNLIKDPVVKGNWSTSGAIPTVSNPKNQQQIYYTVYGIVYPTNGYLHVAYINNPAITDSIKVVIAAQPAKLLNAFTRDYNGNGYLDAIELVFNKKIVFADTFDLLNLTIVRIVSDRDPFQFEIKSISPRATPDSLFTIYLKEDSTTIAKEPQTDWRPLLSIINHPDINAATVTRDTTTDGAGPVIWNVTKTADPSGDHTKDRVTVVFSENVFNAQMTMLPLSTDPTDLFHVWTYTNGQFVMVDSLLTGITSITVIPPNYKQLSFFMTNNENLTGLNFMTIDSSSGLVFDTANSKIANQPNANNHRVRVIVQGKVGQIVIGPNPLTPVMRHREDVLTWRDPKQAMNWAQTEGGAVITADFVIPSSNDEAGRKATSDTAWVRGELHIYDAVGNMVYSKQNQTNIIPQVWRENWVGGETKQLVFYWNGITKQDLKAAPGIYRAVVYIKSNISDESKYTGNVGVGR
jgi:fibro-slime domain-containing protein